MWVKNKRSRLTLNEKKNDFFTDHLFAHSVVFSNRFLRFCRVYFSFFFFAHTIQIFELLVSVGLIVFVLLDLSTSWVLRTNEITHWKFKQFPVLEYEFHSKCVLLNLRFHSSCTMTSFYSFFSPRNILNLKCYKMKLTHFDWRTEFHSCNEGKITWKKCRGSYLSPVKTISDWISWSHWSMIM